MSSFDSWLQPLRAYPSGLVLACVILTAGGVCWLIAKLLKWSVYLAAWLLFAGVAAAFGLWLWT
jgi:hypothetical protein